MSAVDAETRARGYFGTLRVHDAAPTNSMACGAILGAAHSLLKTDRLGDVLAKSFESEHTTTPARAGWARIFAKYESSCSQRLRTAATPLIRTYARTRSWTTFRPTRYRAEHIPAHLEQSWYDRHLRDLDGHTESKTLRRVAAIQLVQWATQDSLAEAARYLGIDTSEMPHNVEDNIRIWLNSPNEVQDFGRALQNLAIELHRQAEGLIDYQYRRDALLGWALTPGTWQDLTSQLKRAHGRRPVLDDRKRQEASVFIWAQVTHGEHLFAPRPIEAEQPPAIQQDWSRRRNTTWFQLCRPDPMGHYADLRKALVDHGQKLARDIDAGNLLAN
ncbi:hypothetical protein [Streptomyces sp. NPDC048361]|uniref:hypothetical protein n=1 Tax=Streptomyces sp. NPDC048361 TaxID=3154720 RepID=UPI003431138B